MHLIISVCLHYNGIPMHVHLRILEGNVRGRSDVERYRKNEETRGRGRERDRDRVRREGKRRKVRREKEEE